MDKLIVLPDHPVLRIGDRLTLNLDDARQLRAALEAPEFTVADDGSHRYAADLEFLGVRCQLFVTAASVLVSFNDYAEPDNVLSLPQVRQFMKCHPLLPHTSRGLAWVEFHCPETSWRQMAFFHDKKNGHTTFRTQL